MLSSILFRLLFLKYHILIKSKQLQIVYLVFDYLTPFLPLSPLQPTLNLLVLRRCLWLLKQVTHFFFFACAFSHGLSLCMIMTFSGVLHQLQDFERLTYCHLASSTVEKSKTILNPFYVIHFLSGNLIFFASALKFYSMCLAMGLLFHCFGHLVGTFNLET